MGLSATTSTFYILFLWTPVYLSELKGYMTQAHADSMNVMIVTTYIVFLLLAGRASDSFPHRTDLMFIGLPGIIVACPVMFSMFESEQWWGIFHRTNPTGGMSGHGQRWDGRIRGRIVDVRSYVIIHRCCCRSQHGGNLIWWNDATGCDRVVLHIGGFGQRR